MKSFTSRLDQIQSLCKKNQVAKLFVFGSVVNGRFNIEKCDVDMLVDVNEKDPIKKGDYILNLWDGLEEILNEKLIC